MSASIGGGWHAVNVRVLDVSIVVCILASGSPRRSALLRQIGIEPTIRPADIDETPRPNEAPAVYVERLAREKAAVGACEPGAVVIAADTTVTIDGEILGKPESAGDAVAMLTRLSGRHHHVLTGIAVRTTDRTVSAVESTVVHFGDIDERDMSWYVESGEPLDKAGAYGLQGGGGAFAVGIDGSPDNVTGLPRHRLAHLLAEVGLTWSDLRS